MVYLHKPRHFALNDCNTIVVSMTGLAMEAAIW